MTDSIGANGALGNNAKAQLLSFIERVERLEEEKKSLADDIKDVFAEAKGNGFDVKALRVVLKRRKADAEKLAEHEAIVETYMNALGMLADTPLGQSAMDRARVNSKRHLRESMKDSAAVAQEMADAGMISPEAAAEHKDLAGKIARKLG